MVCRSFVVGWGTMYCKYIIYDSQRLSITYEIDSDSMCSVFV